LFLVPIFLHSGDLTPAWHQLNDRVQAELAEVVSPHFSLVERARFGSPTFDSFVRDLGYARRDPIGTMARCVRNPVGFVARNVRKYLLPRR
jgi:hypothetical protein